MKHSLQNVSWYEEHILMKQRSMTLCVVEILFNFIQKGFKFAAVCVDFV